MIVSFTYFDYYDRCLTNLQLSVFLNFVLRSSTDLFITKRLSKTNGINMFVSKIISNSNESSKLDVKLKMYMPLKLMRA